MQKKTVSHLLSCAVNRTIKDNVERICKHSKSSKNNHKLAELVLKQENAVEQFIYILLNAHGIIQEDSKDLPRKLLAKLELQITHVPQKVPKSILNKCTGFVKAFYGSAITDQKRAVIEDIKGVLLYYQNSFNRPIRFFAVHTSTILLETLCNAISKKQQLIEHLRQLKKIRKMSEEESTIAWLQEVVKEINEGIIHERKNDVMVTIKKCIADFFLYVVESATAAPVLDRSTVKLIVEFIYDRNKAIKKKAIFVLSQLVRSGFAVVEEPAITRLILIGYKENATLAVPAIKLLGKLAKLGRLTDTSLKYVYSLMFRPFPAIAKEAAKFLVEVVDTIDLLAIIRVLSEILEPIEDGFKKRFMQKAVLALQHEVPDLSSASKIMEILKGNAVDKRILGTTALMLRVALKERIICRSVDMEKALCYQTLEELLRNYEQESWISHLLKIVKYIPKWPCKSIGEIFRKTQYEEIALAAVQALHCLNNDNPTYQDFLEFIENIGSFEVINLVKVSILCCYCSVEQVIYFQRALLPHFSHAILKKTLPSETMRIILQCLFNAHANYFAHLCNFPSEIHNRLGDYTKLRDDVLSLYLATMKLYKDVPQISSFAFTLIAKLLSITSNEVIKAKSAFLHYELEPYTLDIVIEFLVSFTKAHPQHEEVQAALELLLLTSVTAFHSKLLILYLVVLGGQDNSFENVLIRIKAKCGGDLCLVYSWIKSAIIYCMEFEGGKLVRAKTLIKEAVYAFKDEQPKAYERFLIELLKTSLKSITNFPLLEVLALGVNTTLLSKDQLYILLQRFEAYLQHIAKTYKHLPDNSMAYLRTFRKHLVNQLTCKTPKQKPMKKYNTQAFDEELSEIEEKLDDEGTLIPKRESNLQNYYIFHFNQQIIIKIIITIMERSSEITRTRPRKSKGPAKNHTINPPLPEPAQNGVDTLKPLLTRPNRGKRYIWQSQIKDA
eukprot:TRINITY_DN3507_c0_g1_i1.p1 TRINITY_DN3507_c0_g1~~TRINITY_DN3507_c0_g1_i1.p1  ORF type:complete len:952 (-),score=89.76 TRINITY_DN3507_c0_g1_i1:2194-5049(-)